MLDITKCFSILIASGNGDRCNSLKSALHNELYTTDPLTNKFKVVIMKHGKHSMPEDHKRIAKSVSGIVSPFFKDIPDFFFSIDLPKERRVQ